MTKNLITVIIGMILLGGCQKVDLSEYLPEKESGYAVTFKLSDYSILILMIRKRQWLSRRAPEKPCARHANWVA